MKVFLVVILILLAVLFLFVLVASWFLSGFSMGVKRQTLTEARKWQEDHYDLSWYDPLEKTEYTVQSYDGYLLHAEFLKNPVKTDRYVLISHGYTDNRFGSLKYTRMYLDFGFNVILYDLRAHGLNEPTYVTYSVRESRDLLAMIRDSEARFANMRVFGLQGESLGAATSVAVLKYTKRPDFVVADCGFSEIIPVLKVGLKSMHLPGFLVYPASLVTKLRYGLFYSEMRPIDSLKDSQVPILFMHGKEDSFIVPGHSEAMLKAAKGPAKLHLVDGANHAESAIKAPEEYRETVGAFLKELGLI